MSAQVLICVNFFRVALGKEIGISRKPAGVVNAATNTAGREAEESMDSPGATMALFPDGTETEVSMPYLMTQGQSPRATRILNKHRDRSLHANKDISDKGSS